MQERVTTSRIPIRIAIDARYVREKPSGIGVYVQALIDRLPSLGRDDKFLFWAHPLSHRPLSSAPNVVDVTVRVGANSLLSVSWPKRFASFDDVDVFHSPHNLLPRDVPCASVVTIHDLMSIDEPKLHLQGIERVFKNFYYVQAVWRALHRATHLIAPTKATADRICARAPDAARRVTVIPEAADESFHPPNDMEMARKQAAQLTGSDAPYLLLVGANTPTKRHDLAIAAFAKAVPPPWRLVLLQRRRASAALVRLARSLDIANRVVWLGAVAKENVVTLIQAAEGLIQPSLYEGFGLPVLEAMACGCPVIASDIPPFREITAGAALLVPPNDVDKLADALRDFVKSQEIRRSLGAQGLARAREFSWDRCARQTLEVYHGAALRQP